MPYPMAHQHFLVPLDLSRIQHQVAGHSRLTD
jgi:hypothetical protein